MLGKKKLYIILICILMMHPLTITANTQMHITNETNTGSDTNTALQITDHGYYTDKDEKYGDAVHYWAVIKNNNKSKTIKNPKIEVTVKDVDGNVLDTKETEGHYIAPKDTVILDGVVFLKSSAVHSVDIQAEEPHYAALKTVPSSAFKVSNISEIQGDFQNAKVTGELKYIGKKKVSSVEISAVYKNNNTIVYAASTDFDDIQKHKKTAFEIDPHTKDIPVHDSIVIYVQEG